MPCELTPASFSILLSDGIIPLTTLTRTIHPVGQGAFYSEIFNVRKEKFTAVYDCGSNNNAPLSSEIDEFNTVDLIFISHFHNDHINGIKKIQQKGEQNPLIIIPGISHYAFVIDLISNYLHTGDTKCDSISFMLDCLPALSSANNANRQNQIIIGQDRNWASRIIVVQEGVVPIGVPDPTDGSEDSFLWRYDAYFHKYDKTKEKELILQLSKRIPILAANQSGDFQNKEWYRDLIEGLSVLDLDDIKEVFTSIYKGHPNRYSMLVHSYPVDKRKKYMECLYTGDIMISQPVKTTIINIKPHYIQVPHHGAKNNYDESIYNKYQIAFMSLGLNNSHKHPDKDTLIKLIQKCETVHVITENEGSKYKCRFKLK